MTISTFTEQIGFLDNLTQKFNDRILVKNVEHTSFALESLASGGLFGTYRYTRYLPEASSDYALTTMAHYLGFSFIIVIFMVLIPFAYTGTRQYINSSKTLPAFTGRLAFVYIMISLIYNTYMVLGVTPVLGVQPLFCGSSDTIWITSAIWAGVLTFDSEVHSKGGRKIRALCKNFF